MSRVRVGTDGHRWRRYTDTQYTDKQRIIHRYFRGTARAYTLPAHLLTCQLPLKGITLATSTAISIHCYDLKNSRNSCRRCRLYGVCFSKPSLSLYRFDFFDPQKSERPGGTYHKSVVVSDMAICAAKKIQGTNQPVTPVMEITHVEAHH